MAPIDGVGRRRRAGRRVAATLALAALTAGVFASNTNRAEAAPGQPIRAGALYFGTWNAGASNIIDATKRVYGRDGDWWGGVRDYSGQDPSVPTNRWLWPDEDFSHLKPAIGWYDDSQPTTVEKHIAQATSAGLSFFTFYWYWDGHQGAETIAAGLHSFLAARNRDRMDFAIAVCAHSYGDGRLEIPKAQYKQAVQTIAGYVAEPNYLRANDGRPIVELCDTRGLGSGSEADIKAFVDAVRAAVLERTGEKILVLVHRDLGLDPGPLGANGRYCGARIDTVGQSYKRYVNEQRSFFAATPGTFIRCATSDFDERPRYPHMVPDEARIRFFPDQTPELFAKSLVHVRDDIAESTSRPAAVDSFVQMYAWNEWHEGGIIEPNVRDGCLHLNIIQRELALPGTGCGRPPALSVEAKRKQRLTKKRKAIVVRVACDEDCDVTATAKLRPRKAGKAKPATAFLRAGQQAKLKLALKKKVRKRIERKLRRGKMVRAMVSIHAADLATDATAARAKVRITGKKRKRR